VRRAATALIAALALGVAGWGATTRGGASAAGDGVTVGSARVSLEAIEAEAARLAGGRPRRLAAARRAAADRAIERLWLDGEAAARGLRPGADLVLLRGAVADALAGRGPERSARRFARAFDAFHERWRSRTRCAGAYHDPYEDRCGNRAGAAAGTCRWMGEATLCSLSGDRRARWLVVQDAARVRRVRSRARAVALAIEIYSSARAARAEAARRARRARAAADAERAAAALAERRARERAARSSERAARMRDPHLSEPALAGARAACERQVADSDPYMFGFGMQDVVGGAEGLIAARAALARGLMGAAQDGVDRRKLRPLVLAVAAGNRELARLAAADAADDHAAAARVLASLDARTAPERALARRLELGDCLVRPAR
jgi:hypothetical protein